MRQRAAPADAPRGSYLRLALGVGTPTLPPIMPAFIHDDGRFRFLPEPSIVVLCAPDASVIRNPANCSVVVTEIRARGSTAVERRLLLR